MLVEQLVNDSDAGPALDADSDHTGDVVEVALGEPLGAVERVDPDHHVVLVELIRKLLLVLQELRCHHIVDLLHFFEVPTVAIFLLALEVG